MDKEEIIETEEKIEKALKKEQEQRIIEKQKGEDFDDSESKILLSDKAEELKDEIVNNKVNYNLFCCRIMNFLSIVSSPQFEGTASVDPKIKKVVENQNEKIVAQTSTTPSTSNSSGSSKPKDKVI